MGCEALGLLKMLLILLLLDTIMLVLVLLCVTWLRLLLANRLWILR